jgi:hypothetical protein
MQIESNDRQPQNVPSSIDESFATGSNVTAESDRHAEKQSSESVSTDDGIQMDESDRHEANASVGIDESLQSDSNATAERRPQLQKHRRQRFVREEGMQIPRSRLFDLEKLASDFICSTRNAMPSLVIRFRGISHSMKSE